VHLQPFAFSYSKEKEMDKFFKLAALVFPLALLAILLTGTDKAFPSIC
jgi:hypothetical protein